MTDRDRLDEMLRSLGAYVGEPQRLRGVEENVFLSNRDMGGNAKYHFIIAIECCVDIAHHVIAARRLRTPRDYGDAFRALEEAALGGGELEDLRVVRVGERCVLEPQDVELGSIASKGAREGF